MFAIREGVKPVDMFRLPDSEDARMMKQESRAIQMILGLKRMPDIYIRPQYADYYNQPGGEHIPRKIRKSIIYLDAVQATKGGVYNLAHELFHEYQFVMTPDEFRILNKAKYELEHELDAIAFAVAYTEERCAREGWERNRLFPRNGINHISFPSEYKANKDRYGVPEVVRSRAENLRKELLEGKLI